MVHLFTSFTYNDPCQLVKAGRAFDPKIQKISYIYKLNINIRVSSDTNFFRFTYRYKQNPHPACESRMGDFFAYLLFKY